MRRNVKHRHAFFLNNPNEFAFVSDDIRVQTTSAKVADLSRAMRSVRNYINVFFGL